MACSHTTCRSRVFCKPVLGPREADGDRRRSANQREPTATSSSPLALRSPIYVRGTFAQPTVGVDKGRVALRAAGAVALGLINPLLTIVPLIDRGPGQDSDCKQLIREAKTNPP